MKKVLSIILILALTLSLVACTTTGNVGLYDAFKNMQEVNAIETNTEMSFDLSGEGLGGNETIQLNQIANVINSIKLNVKSKSVGNEEGTAAKAESQINIDFMGMNIPLESWSEINLEESEMITISRMPEIVLAMLFAPMDDDTDNPLGGKEYIVNDMAAMSKAEGEDMDIEEMLEFQKEFEPKLIEFMEEIEEDLELETEIIKAEEEREIEGEKIRVYRLKLNDESLREALKDTVNYLLENKATREFVVEYIDAYIDTMKKMGMQDELSQSDLKELEEGVEDFEKDLDGNLDKVKKEFNAFMDKHKDIEILGEEGINILYSINEDGYIVEKDGVIDLSLDLAQMAELQDEKDLENIESLDEEPLPEAEMKGRIKLKINFKSNNANINSEELAVELPEITRQNSMSMDEMMEIQMEMMEEFEGMKIEE